MKSTSSSTPAERVIVGGDEVRFRLTSDESGGALLAFEVRIPPGGGPPMLHRHDPFELYRIEQGELSIYLEEGGGVTRTIAGPGATIGIPGGREHTVRNESDDEARAFVTFLPGREMERFIREAGGIARRGAPSIKTVLGLASSRGIEITRRLEAAA